MPASRTPEGLPSRCPLCGAANDIAYSATGGDAPCPACGHLLLRSHQVSTRLRREIAGALGVDPGLVGDDFRFAELSVDSLDTVGVVMALEESFDLDLPEEELEGVESIQDLVKLIVRHSDP